MGILLLGHDGPEADSALLERLANRRTAGVWLRGDALSSPRGVTTLAAGGAGPGAPPPAPPGGARPGGAGRRAGRPAGGGGPGGAGGGG
ncbi:MAG: hypothetical protein AAGD06_17740, partial [Acidobacteriota bacterium]